MSIGKLQAIMKRGMAPTRIEIGTMLEEIFSQQEQFIRSIKTLAEAVQAIGDAEDKAAVRKILKRSTESVFKGAF